MEYKILVADDDRKSWGNRIYLTNEQMKVLTACDDKKLKGTWGKSWYTPYYYGFNDA